MDFETLKDFWVLQNLSFNCFECFHLNHGFLHTELSHWLAFNKNYFSF